jgi:asparagine synthase (glutamine-hydrolysing)
MCGLAGLLSGGATPPDCVAAMADRIAHRGPDDRGVWTDSAHGVGIGHRRLSIVDLSASGHQPIVSADARWVLAYNGEIYNHRELRAAVEAVGGAPPGGWHGHSDTETLLQAIAIWGVDATIERCTGMFAFAAWDRRDRRLYLARDRFGEKPLYYGWVGADFVFASELKAIRAHPAFCSGIDRTALAGFAARGYVAEPRSIYAGIFKLPPGCLLSLDRAAADRPRSQPPEVSADASDGVALRRYWSYRTVFEQGRADPFRSEDEALEAIEAALASAIRGQAVADVNVGAFLSGGIDSSTVVALYRRHTTGRIATYSIGFEEAGFDEAPYAAAVARHFGTEHHSYYVSVEEARGVIPLLPAMYDEPFADSSQIPTFLVSRFARNDVTVGLSGDGGDELFAGYNRHVVAPALWRRLNAVPAPLRQALGPLGALPSGWLQRLGQALPGARQPHFGAKVQKALRLGASARDFREVYAGFLDEWSLAGSPVLGGADPRLELDSAPAGWSDTERTMLWDALTYLPGDILVKVDRAAMACSLETRAPLLDHHVAAAAARVPLAMKIRDGKGKDLLRQLLFRHAPAEMFDRPKTGFAVPVGQWIRGPLREWAESLLARDRLASQGLFDPDMIEARWRAHLSGRSDATAALWAVLMFQAWHDEQAAAHAG